MHSLEKWKKMSHQAGEYKQLFPLMSYSPYVITEVKPR